jgi:hypothetical protein
VFKDEENNGNPNPHFFIAITKAAASGWKDPLLPPLLSYFLPVTHLQYFAKLVMLVYCFKNVYETHVLIYSKSSTNICFCMYSTVRENRQNYSLVQLSVQFSNMSERKCVDCQECCPVWLFFKKKYIQYFCRLSRALDSVVLL